MPFRAATPEAEGTQHPLLNYAIDRLRSAPTATSWSPLPPPRARAHCFNLPVLQTRTPADPVAMRSTSTRPRRSWPTSSAALRKLMASLPDSEPIRRVARPEWGGYLPPSASAFRRTPSSSILLANPDIGPLRAPCRSIDGWRRLLEGLDTLVLDELHAYRGVFGSHVSLIVRRLRRPRRPVRRQPAGDRGLRHDWQSPPSSPSSYVGLPFVEVPGDGAAARGPSLPPLAATAQRIGRPQRASQHHPGVRRRLRHAPPSRPGPPFSSATRVRPSSRCTLRLSTSWAPE